MDLCLIAHPCFHAPCFLSVSNVSWLFFSICQNLPQISKPSDKVTSEKPLLFSQAELAALSPL